MINLTYVLMNNFCPCFYLIFFRPKMCTYLIDIYQPINDINFKVYGDLEQAKSHEQLKLLASEQLVAAINSCFHPDIFLRPLGDKFLKLSFQAVSR